MESNFDVFAKILAPALTAVAGFLIKRYLEARPKLITYLIHSSTITLPSENSTLVNSHSIVVRNAGKKTAHNVRIGHYSLPAFQIFPQLMHEVTAGANGSAELLVPTLVPGEQITLSYLYFPPTTFNQINAYCKSDEMAAKYLNVIPTTQPNKFQITTAWLLMFVGASTLLYWLIYWLLAWIQKTA